MRKDFLQEIRYSKNRFLSILLIVALGVAFFSGIRATSPDMKKTADEYYDKTNLMDIRVLGTWGLEQKDIDKIAGMDGVEQVVSAYSADVFGSVDENQYVIKVLSMPKGINMLDLYEGEFPKKEGECVVDKRLVDFCGYQIGQTLSLKSGNEDDISDTFSRTKYTITGIVNSSYYMDRERGSASIGDGGIDGFVVISEKNFCMDVYTEAYVTVEGVKALSCYTNAYEDQVKKVQTPMKEWFEKRAKNRYQSTLKEAKEKIADGEKKVKDGKKKTDDAEVKLADGKKEIENGEKKIAESEKEIENGEKEIVNAKEELVKGKAEYKKEKAKANRKLEDAKTEIINQENQLNSQENALQDKKSETNKKLTAAKKQIDASEIKLQQAKQQIDQMEAVLPENDPQLTAAVQAYQTNLLKAEAATKQWQAQKKAADEQFIAAQNKIDSAREKIKAAWNQYDAQRNRALAEWKKAETKLVNGQKQIDTAQSQLVDARKKLTDGKADLIKAKNKYKKGVKDLANARSKLKTAKKKLADAKDELTDIKEPKYYVLDRNSIVSYVSYEQDADRIKAIGEVFPVIFFLVAALVSLTTMTRMVEGERTQIGTLKALGYSKGSIALKYLLYALLATIFGSLLGIVVGQKTLPPVIISAYKLMYEHLPGAVIPLNFWYSLTSSLAAIGTTTAATLLACYKELSAPPAVLMRPIAPQNGKRVLLERITPIWKHFNFTGKVTLRNLFRYKKRFFMSIFGIGGCMALLLVGFGIKNSIFSIIDIQYNKTLKYSVTLGIDENADDTAKMKLNQQLSADKMILAVLNDYQISQDVTSDRGTEVSAFLVIPEDKNQLNDFYSLNNRKTSEVYHLNDNGAIVTEKLAKLLDVKIGDTITLKDSEEGNKKAKITAITENHIYHYVYLSKDLYEQLYKKKYESNQVLVKTSDKSSAAETTFSKKYLAMKAVSSVTLTSTTRAATANMLKGMDVVIYVLIISAGALAFVVLYNLNNINISERKRELATIKVLGFYDMEVAEYVYRENIFLTVIGIIFGILLGIVLHQYVIVTAELDMIMFGRRIFPLSYLYSSLLTIGFSMIVNFVLYFKLKKIDMIESLKSVE